MRDNGGFSITNTTNGRLQSLPFKALLEAVLGKSYDLSLVIIGDSRSRELNLHYRGKDAPANVLSFPLSKQEGEIFLNLKQIKRDEKKFGVTGAKLVARMFIHGLFHLKGMEHGSRMERHEEALRTRFSL